MRLVILSLIAATAVVQPAMARPAKPQTAEIAEQNRRTDALNAEAVRQIAESRARDAAQRAAYATALADYRRQQDERAAAMALANSSYNTAMQRWRIDVTACQAGQKDHCHLSSD